MTPKPRMDMVDPDNCTEDQRRILLSRSTKSISNMSRMLANNPPFLETLGAWSPYFFQRSTLPVRDREILILRCAWITRTEYQWALHKPIALAADLSPAEIERIKQAPEAAGWSAYEAALIRSVDELHRDNCITDSSWAVLAAELSPAQLIDVIFIVGQTLMIASAVKTLSMPMDPGLAGF